LQSKLWILKIFCEQHPPDHLGTNLKNDLCHRAFISHIKHAEFGVKALNVPHNDLKIQELEVLVQNPTGYLAEKGFNALVID